MTKKVDYLKKVIISSSAEKLISMSNINIDTEIDLKIGSPLSELTSILENNTNQYIICIIFALESEYAVLKGVTDISESDKFHHSYILISDDDNQEKSDFLDSFDIFQIFEKNLSQREFVFSINNAFKILNNQLQAKMLGSDMLAQLLDMQQDQEDLINIGRSLSIEKNQDKLLRLILKLSKKITGADAGSIYLIEETAAGNKQIRFKYSHTFSKNIPLEEFVIPYDKSSIAGYVALTGTVLNIPDVYNLSESDPISFNNTFDLQNNYRTKSMLVVPMKNHLDEIIGVIQLINSKEPDETRFATGNEAYEIILKKPDDFMNYVSPFKKRYEHLMESIAGQAAIAIENNRMVKQIQTQFEEFVKASVSAIESRDPATSGHSFRVAKICTLMATAVSNTDRGVFKDIYFTASKIKELEYAALLHDFGKVYIDLAIFMKSKKLYPKDLDNLILKINYLYRWVELQYFIKENCSPGVSNLNNLIVQNLPDEKENVLNAIFEIKEKLLTLNEPTVLDEDPAEVISNISNKINNIECYDIEGHLIEVLNGYERTNLSIKRGSLNAEERKEIESHVTHTYNFVKRIPWPPEYKDIPLLAKLHHEKNDGSGYPDGIKEKDIPIQAQMMAIADIYDALTATDRPYKKAMPHERAVKIIQEEGEKNKLNKDLVSIFIDSGINIANL